MTAPVRSLLFAPANRGDFIAKFGRVAADAFVIDLEDGLAPDARPQARTDLSAIVRQARDAAAASARIWVRVNSPGTADFAPDCAAVANARCDGLVLSKAETAEEVQRSAALTALPVLAGIESLEGVYAADEIAHAAALGLFFGAEDYVADLGGVRTPAGEEVLYARSVVAMAARRARTAALDLVTVDIRDDARFDADALAGRALGYTGKMCVTPRQVERANAIYRPSAVAIEDAQRVIQAYAEAKVRGLGAIDFEGRMIDEPLVRQAQAIVAAAAG
ncbi:CoA ester lyase [Sphingosinicella sp. LY1275]|uniref:HpcH/HpaI aldolase/citrate lyase family protein n=1 Tax=Sphingosinicella sp. LY1275 TaxID=3095379 RepID=UPI002ADED7CE|nr:CoA ester lyase [Sphingosinicella sp. LY1275]MEA1015361.1 CoA ester lyase [Sphingosinicella sp. LY1275]